MKKILLSIAALICMCLVCIAETKTYKISSYCTMDIPSTLVLRDTPGVGGAQYCFWPGLNSKYYSRILVTIGDANGLSESDIKSASKADLDALSNSQKSQLISAMKRTGQDASRLKWYPITLESVNGHFAMVQKCIRPGLNGDVYSINYMMVYKGARIEFTLSYRVSESNLWKADFEKVMKTIVWK